MIIEFQIQNEYNDFLTKILDGIDFNNYSVKIFEDEVFDLQSNFLFNKKEYSYIEFLSYIKNKQYYLTFFNLQLYRITNSNKKIMNYNDFYNSECELILFVTDCEYVQIYCKDELKSKLIYDNAKKNKFVNVNYTTNIRKIFSAYTD